MTRDDPAAPRSAWSEADRLAALASYGILDTPVEQEFEDVVRLAADICDTPIALISLVAEERQWFKAETGLGGTRETPRDVSVCAHALRHRDVFVVPDLRSDPRFAASPLVTGGMAIRFYAGAVLETPDGLPLGTICVIDRVPRPDGLTPRQLSALGVLAKQVMAQFELRRALKERDQAFAEERTGTERARLVAEATNDAIWDWDLVRDHVVWNAALHEAYGHRPGEVGPDGAWWLAQIHPEDRQRVHDSIDRAIAGTAMQWRDEYRFRRADGGYADVFDRGSLIRDPSGRAVRMIGAMLDLTERRQAGLRRNALAELGERLRDLDDTALMAFAAAEVMGRALGVERAGYGTIDPELETITIERDWTVPGIPSLAGVLHFRDFGSYIDDLKRGEAAVIADAELDPRTAATADALKSIGARAFINLPVVEHGRFVALFYLTHTHVRPWSEEDVAFVRTVADRTRAAVERVRVTAALLGSEERFRVFAQAMPNQVWAADSSGRLDWLNEQVHRYFGLAADGSRGRGWMSFVHPDDVPTAAERWARSIAGGVVYETEFRLRRHDGAYRWYLARALPIRDGQGAVVRWIGTNTDVHDQKESAAELARLNSQLEGRVEERTRERDRLWATTNDLMGTAGLDGYLKAVNPAWERMLGWSERELLERPFLDLIESEDHAETADVVARLARGETVSGFVDHIRQKDGAIRMVTWNAVPSDGDVFYIVGRDITAEREIEEQLRQSQKMEAVGQLTGGIAHDFNNLLTGIVGSLDLMQTRMTQGRTENLERYAKAAMSSANRAAALTHRLLAFARRQPLDPKPVDANALVTSLEDLLRRTIGEAIGLEIVTAGGLWPTLCDPHQLESAILNLAINARDAMPDGGKLVIETCNTHLDRTYSAQHPGVVAGQYICLCVTDTGSGMTQGVIGRAFDPFFTTKPIGQGTGLGLSMVYGFARQSEGHAKIYSEVGQGTTVKIYLPRHLGSLPRPEEEPRAADDHRATTGETVLVVEDEPVVRDLVVEVLNDLGYQALEAIDGPAGLAVLQSGIRVDLLVTDVGLPGLNGRQLADQARLTRPDLRVLFITGYAENAALASGFLDPGMEMITKPFPVEALASRIRGMIER